MQHELFFSLVSFHNYSLSPPPLRWCAISRTGTGKPRSTRCCWQLSYVWPRKCAAVN